LRFIGHGGGRGILCQGGGAEREQQTGGGESKQWFHLSRPCLGGKLNFNYLHIERDCKRRQRFMRQ
jgi:hypothetical protein